MIRLVALMIALVCIVPALAAPLPAGLDPQNTIFLDTRYGRVIIRLRPELAPKHAERGDGTGKSKYPDLPAEFSKVPFTRGVVGMARATSPNSANSQFFIMFGETPSLNGQYTVVGEVVSGMEVIDRIKKGSSANNGAVTDPDRIVRMEVAADAK